MRKISSSCVSKLTQRPSGEQPIPMISHVDWSPDRTARDGPPAAGTSMIARRFSAPVT